MQPKITGFCESSMAFTGLCESLWFSYIFFQNPNGICRIPVKPLWFSEGFHVAFVKPRWILHSFTKPLRDLQGFSENPYDVCEISMVFAGFLHGFCQRLSFLQNSYGFHRVLWKPCDFYTIMAKPLWDLQAFLWNPFGVNWTFAKVQALHRVLVKPFFTWFVKSLGFTHVFVKPYGFHRILQNWTRIWKGFCEYPYGVNRVFVKCLWFSHGSWNPTNFIKLLLFSWGFCKTKIFTRFLCILWSHNFFFAKCLFNLQDCK